MMSTFVAPYRMRLGLGAFLACCTLGLSACGLGLETREELYANSSINKTTNPSPTPSPTSSNTPDGGPTASVTGTVGGQAVSFPYVLLNTDSSGNPALEFLSYDPCLWAESHSSSTFPLDFNTLIVELVSLNAAPGPGVYTDVAGTQNTSSQSIDPNSSFGSITSCKGSWTALAAGTSVSIEAIDTTSGSASGTISAQLDGGGILSGKFSTTSCNTSSTNFAANDANACSSLQ